MGCFLFLLLSFNFFCSCSSFMFAYFWALLEPLLFLAQFFVFLSCKVFGEKGDRARCLSAELEKTTCLESVHTSLRQRPMY